MADLNGKVALVTGAPRGIGAAIAKRLAADGANVVVVNNSSESHANELVESIDGVQAKAVRANLRDPRQIKRLFEQTLETFGRLDILVNNAGTFFVTTLDAVTRISMRCSI